MITELNSKLGEKYARSISCKENEVKHTEEDYVRVVPSVMGLLTLPDGRRVQRLSESHYLKKNLSRFSPIGGAEAVSLEGLTELSEAVDGLILYEIPRSHQQEGKPNLSETPYPNEHGSEYDLRVYIAESQMDNFYEWMNNTTLRQGVDGIIRECYEELALEARIEGYDPVLPELTSSQSAQTKLVYTLMYQSAPIRPRRSRSCDTLCVHNLRLATCGLGNGATR